MKINQPTNDEEHADADAEHAQIAKEQRRMFYDMAERIEAGQPLSSAERAIAAATLRHFGKNISESRPRPAGKPATLPDFELVIEFVRLTRHKALSKNAAIETLAWKYFVSTNAVKKRLGMGSSAEARARREDINGTLQALGLEPL